MQFQKVIFNFSTFAFAGYGKFVFSFASYGEAIQLRFEKLIFDSGDASVKNVNFSTLCFENILFTSGDASAKNVNT
jgi:hypothetical protein